MDHITVAWGEWLGPKENAIAKENTETGATGLGWRGNSKPCQGPVWGSRGQEIVGTGHHTQELSCEHLYEPRPGLRNKDKGDSW